MALQHLGTVPAGTPLNTVTSFVMSQAPGIIVERRATYAALVWDADGGWQWPWSSRSSMEDNGNGTFTAHIGQALTNPREVSFHWAPATTAVGPQGPQGPSGPQGPQGDPSPVAHGYLMSDLATADVVTEGDVATVIGSSAAGDWGHGEQYRWTATPEASEDFHAHIDGVSGQWVRLRQDKSLIVVGTGTTSPPIGAGYVSVAANGSVIISLWDALRTPGHVIVVENESTQLGATIVGSFQIVGPSRYGVFVARGEGWYRIDHQENYVANASASGSIVLDYYGPRATYALTLTGNVTITFPSAAAGAQMGDEIDLLLMQDGTGGHTSSFTSGADTGAYLLSNDTGNVASSKKFIRLVRAFDRWCATPRQTYAWA